MSAERLLNRCDPRTQRVNCDCPHQTRAHSGGSEASVGFRVILAKGDTREILHLPE